MNSFTPLHIYSGYSYLKSGLILNKIPSIAKTKGFSSVGLCDIGTMNGYAPFFHECKRIGVNPVFGFDIEFEEGILSFFVLNEEGYRNALKIVYESSKKTLNKEELKKYIGGLKIICPMDGLNFSHQNDDFVSLLTSFLRGLGDVYLGMPYLPDDKEYISFIREFASSHSYKTIAFPKIAYKEKDDAITLEIVKAIEEKNNLDILDKKGNEYFLDSETIESYYTKEEIDATSFASSFELIKKRGSLLIYPNNEGKSSDIYLKEAAFAGINSKISNPNDEYISRLNYELDVIIKMGYADYFLLVKDYIDYARSHSISVGPGRGSAGGSLVAYALGIIEADPLKYGLLFERFLNPERQSMPDIDVDFADSDRDMVVDYLIKKYGENRVSHIITSQTIMAKEALRDIARVYKYPERTVDLLISSLKDDRKTLRDNYRISKEFRNLVDSDSYYLNYVRLASKIEGLPRQSGLHAAGIVINNESLDDVLPIIYQEGIGTVACLEKDYLEEQGFLKFDILSLSNLTTIDRCLASIKENQGKDIKQSEIPFDDKGAIEIIAKGYTAGLFQVEQRTSSWAIPQIKPSSLSDMIALISLIRPGPSDNIPTFSRRKNGEERITYLCPELEPILKETYGIIVYQEQIMQIVRSLAGFSYGQADLFRRAISKKDSNKLASLHDSFIKGCVNNGKSESLGEEIYQLIFKFAEYGFNKSHALCYAIITCRMAYLKRYYPSEFFAAILDTTSPGDSKYNVIRKEMRRFGINLKNPSVNESEANHKSKGKDIYMPLSSINGVNQSLSAGIIDERTLNGPFVDYEDFIKRMYPNGLNKKNLLPLIDGGALDGLSYSRTTMRDSLEQMLDYVSLLYSKDGKSIVIDENLVFKPYIEKKEDDLVDNLAKEKAVLKISISGSPLEKYSSYLKSKKAYSLISIDEIKDNYFFVAGLIKEIKEITTKKGDMMAFVSIYDNDNEVEFTLFSDKYKEYSSLLKENCPVLIGARIDRSMRKRYIIDIMENLEEER